MTQFVLDPAKLMETAAISKTLFARVRKLSNLKMGRIVMYYFRGGVGSKVSKTCGSTISVCTLLKMQTVIYSLLMFV